MKRFSFRFQRLLEIKLRVEEVRRGALGQAMAALQAEREALQALERRRVEYRQKEAADRAGMPVETLRQGVHYDLRLRREIGELAQRMRQLEAVIEERRDQLVEATRQRRVYEILREQAAAEHNRRQKRQERIDLDEIGERLHLRRGSERGGGQAL